MRIGNVKYNRDDESKNKGGQLVQQSQKVRWAMKQTLRLRKRLTHVTPTV